MIVFTICLMFGVLVADAGQHVNPAACPLHASHKAQQAAEGSHSAHAAMEARGTAAMGFDQSRASHHFVLTPEGGRIEIHANDAGDEITRRQIAVHLEEISRQFKAGDFRIPAETHDGIPPGVAEMTRLRHDIDYTFERSAHGGRVTITTADAGAREAVHAFLRYQIQEHRTGDPLRPGR